MEKKKSQKLTESICIYLLNLLLTALWKPTVVIFCEKINFAFPYKLISKRNIHVSCYYPSEKNQIENLPTAKPKFMIFIFS